MRVEITPAAKADLVSIRAYLRQRAPQAAAQLGGRLAAACRRLGAHPSRGRPGLVSETREITTVRPYVIVYREMAMTVQILRIWHAAQERG